MKDPHALAAGVGIPLLVIALFGVLIALYYRDEKMFGTRLWKSWTKEPRDFNAPPLGRYESLRRWSDTTFTSLAMQSQRETLGTAKAPSPTVQTGIPPSELKITDVSTRAHAAQQSSSYSSWQVRQHHRTVLNDATLCSEREEAAKKLSRPTPPTICRSVRMPGQVDVQAWSGGGGKRKARQSRASSISETEMRDLQRQQQQQQQHAAVTFHQQAPERRMRSWRSLEEIGGCV